MGGRPGFGFRDSMGVRRGAGALCPGAEGSGGRSLGAEGPRALRVSAGPSPLGQQNMWLKCRWTRNGGGRGRGAAGWRPWPCLQPLEGGVISPPFWGVALPVAVAAGVPHVVQRHHHLVWVRVFVQFHHARHHGGPAVWSEHGGSESWWSAYCVPGTPQCSEGGVLLPHLTETETGLREVRCVPRSTQGTRGRQSSGPVRRPGRPHPPTAHALSVWKGGPRHAQQQRKLSGQLIRPPHSTAVSTESQKGRDRSES